MADTAGTSDTYEAARGPGTDCAGPTGGPLRVPRPRGRQNHASMSPKWSQPPLFVQGAPSTVT